jgi:acetylornithine deacetylase/succinyl-diaminopimelate desuccinylase-like protein
VAVDADPGEVVELLQQLIRNRCVNDGTPESGDERRSVDVLSAVLAGPGVDLEPLAPDELPDRASVVARIEGSDPDAPTLALMGHLDVVPVSPDRWTRDPFGGELVDGEVWGRGAVDMLNQTSAMAVAVRRLADSGLRPRGTLVFLGVADEEAGGRHGAYWLAEHHLDAVRADAVLTEFGGITTNSRHGTSVSVATAEKGAVIAHLRFDGTAAHGSAPYGTDNALLLAAEGVRRLEQLRPRTRITPTWRAWVEAQDLDDATKATLVDPGRLADSLGDLSPRLARTAHACTHTTYAPTVIQGGQKANVIPDRVDVQVDVRPVAGEDHEDVRRTLAELFADLGDRVHIHVGRGIPASESPTGTPVWAAMERAARRAYPDAHLVATPISGSTDARSFRPLGIPAYGFGLLSKHVSMADFARRFHGDDERIDVESLGLSVDLWEHLARDFLG